MDYEQKYKDAFERAKECHIDGLALHQPVKAVIEHIFPELKESEDEKIRKDLIAFLDDIWHLGKNANLDKWSKADCSDWIVWLEKQGEHKPVDKVESKFHEGQWITIKE